MYRAFKKYWTFYATAVIPKVVLDAVTTPVAGESGETITVELDAAAGSSSLVSNDSVGAGQTLTGTGIASGTSVVSSTENTVTNTNITISNATTADLPAGSVVTLHYMQNSVTTTLDYITASDTASGATVIEVNETVNYPSGQTPTISGTGIPTNTTVSSTAAAGSTTTNYTISLSKPTTAAITTGEEIAIAALPSYTPPENVSISVQDISMDSDTTGIMTVVLRAEACVNAMAYVSTLAQALGNVKGYTFKLVSTQSAMNSAYLVFSITADTPFVVGDDMFYNANPSVSPFGTTNKGITLNGASFNNQTTVI